jgi:hypothetical protein
VSVALEQLLDERLEAGFALEQALIQVGGRLGTLMLGHEMHTSVDDVRPCSPHASGITSTRLGEDASTNVTNDAEVRRLSCPDCSRQGRTTK